jgi:tetratricopeptide (TPR) repeat protein
MRIPSRGTTSTWWMAAAAALCCAGCASYTPIRTHFNKGVRLYSEGNYSGAAREYRLAIEDDPMDHRAHFNLAMAHEEMGRTDLARAEYEWILRVRPDDLRASVNLAAIEIEAGEVESGYARLQRMVDAYATLALPRVALGTHYLRDGRLDEAETLVREGLARDDSDIEGNFLLGEILVRRADAMDAGTPAHGAAIDEARQAYHRSLANEPDDVASLLALARLERKAGKPDLSRNYYRRVVLQRRRSEESHRALADLCEEAGDLEEAVRHLWEVRAIAGDAATDVPPRLIRLYAELRQREESRVPAVPAETRP